jgi:hypothetical protein
VDGQGWVRTLIQDSQVNAITLELNDEVSAHCLEPASDESFTMPDDMGDVSRYLNARNAWLLQLTSTGSTLANTDRQYTNAAIGALSRGVPAVVGVNISAGQHYALATKYINYSYELQGVTDPNCADILLEEGFYVDYGWDELSLEAGDNLGQGAAWIGVDAFYAGAIEPPPPDCTTTGCAAGSVCCDCNSPAICTSAAACRIACTK